MCSPSSSISLPIPSGSPGTLGPTQNAGEESMVKGMHWREISTDSSASVSTQCTNDLTKEKPRIDWCDLSSDDDDTVPIPRLRPFVKKLETTKPDSPPDQDVDTTKEHEQPHRLCLAELLDDSQLNLDDPSVVSSKLEGSGTPTTYSDSDNEYYGIGVLWVERDAFKSPQDDADGTHPLAKPLMDLCLRQGATLKRFRSVPNLLRWLTKRRNGTRRSKRSYVCICAQESHSALEAFFQTWEDFVSVSGKPVIYSNQKMDDRDTEVVVPRTWSRKTHFPSFADACATEDFPPTDNVVWVEEDEHQRTNEINQAFQTAGVKNVLRFKTILESIQYFTSRVDNSNGKQSRKKEKQNLRIWPADEPKYTVLCKGRAVALESFFRSWKSNGTDGPAKKLVTYGEIAEEEDKRVIRRVFQGEEAVNFVLEDVENAISSMQDAMSVNYSQLSSEWSSQCGDRVFSGCDSDWAPSDWTPTDWAPTTWTPSNWVPSIPAQTPQPRGSELGSSRQRSSVGGGDRDFSRTPSPILFPQWRSSTGFMPQYGMPSYGVPPSIGCRLVVWRPQGLAPPRGIPAPSWRDSVTMQPHFFPHAPQGQQPMPPRGPPNAPRGPNNMRNAPRTMPKTPNTIAGLEHKRLSKDTKPRPLRSRPLQSPSVRVLGKSPQNFNPRRNRLCTTPLQAPPFPLLAPIQEEQ
eukprot:GEMP01010145.1.p1 GENE.GEMP01010145.1~~GEMP01010145.1.p1  ORF type:complete len:686 (+),score=113.31 GEMP01010145.1:255-2312(+)